MGVVDGFLQTDGGLDGYLHGLSVSFGEMIQRC